MNHCLAVVDNFEGVHDAVGKDPVFLVCGLELVGIQSKNAYQVFQNCIRCLSRTDDDTKWKEYTNNKDERLKRKGRFGMNTRTCWVVCEEKEKYDEYLSWYPVQVLFVDRSCTHDIHGEKALDGTTLLHKVASCVTEIPTTLPRIWPAKVANLPCNCQH